MAEAGRLAAHETESKAGVVTARQVLRRAFVFGTTLLVALVVIQFLLAGLGVFTYAGFFYWHAYVNATIVFFLPLVLVVVGWIGRVPGRLLWLTAALSGLVLVQSLLLLPYHMNAQGVLRVISGLHVVNALFIFWVAVQLMERTQALGEPKAESSGL